MGLKNQLQSPRSSRYLLYIPTDSEYSRLVSSKPTKAELEKILHDARVLDRPGGGRRRVKRFFLLENRSDTDDGHNTFRSEPVIRSRHASRHVIRENRVTDLDRNIPSCSSPSNHLSSRKSSEQLPGEETPASQSPALGDSPAQSVPLQTSRLNPEATEFQPMALPITSTPSVNSNVLDDTSVNLRDSRHSQSNFASGPSRTGNTSDASSCTAASPSQHIFCDGTNEGPSPRVSPTFNYNSRATSGQLPVPIIPFGLTPQFPNVIPPFQVPHDSAHLSFQTAWEQMARVYPGMQQVPLGMSTYPFNLGFPMHTGLPSSTIRSPLPTPLRTPLSSMPPTTHQPLTPLAPITPVALPPPPASKIPKAANPVAIPPPIPPPGNKDSQMQQDFEYYKYTFGKPGLRGPNVRLHRPKSRV